MHPGLLVGLAVAASPGADRCAEARALYESLSLERAVEVAEAQLARRPDALPCLEVRALSLLVLGQVDGARAALEALFARAPDYPIEDPSLSPAMRDTIAAIRESARPLAVTLRGRWLIREELRLDVVLEGGLHGAERVRCELALLPGAGEPAPGARIDVPLLGRVASATVAVAAGAEVASARVTGSVLDAAGRAVARIAAEVPLPGRPPAPGPPAAGAPAQPSVGAWPVWVAIGVGVVGAAVAVAFLARPHGVDTSGTEGRVQIP